MVMLLQLHEHHMCTMNSMLYEVKHNQFKTHQKHKGKNRDHLKLVYSALQFLLKMNRNLEVSFKLSPKVHSKFEVMVYKLKTLIPKVLRKDFKILKGCRMLLSGDKWIKFYFIAKIHTRPHDLNKKAMTLSWVHPMQRT